MTVDTYSQVLGKSLHHPHLHTLFPDKTLIAPKSLQSLVLGPRANWQLEAMLGNIDEARPDHAILHLLDGFEALAESLCCL